MELDFRLALNNEELGPVEPGDDLKVLVMYETVEAGNRAVVRLNSIARGMERPGRLVCALWKYDSLADPSLLMIAAREALAADIVLIAAGARAELPSVVDHWISIWLPKRGCRPSALGAVVWGDECSDLPAAESFAAQLQKMAGFAGINFFAIGGGTEGGKPLSLALHRALTAWNSEPPPVAAAPVEKRSLTAGRELAA